MKTLYKNIEIRYTLALSDGYSLKVKRPGIKRPIYEDKESQKMSRRGRLAREFLSKDRLNKRKIHKVWEKDKNGDWILVHDEVISLSQNSFDKKIKSKN